jgi:hypothetical protein
MEEKSWTSMRFCGTWRPWKLSKLLLFCIPRAGLDAKNFTK